METLEYKTIFENEEKHFYYVGNHGLIISLVKRYFKNRQNLKILDGGCGTGLLAKKLHIFGDVVGVDISAEAIKYAKRRGLKVKKAGIEKLPFNKGAFNLIVCVDVMYHLKVKDDEALKEFYRVLKPGGILILRVPALNWLRRPCDTQVHTRERYNLRKLKRKLIQVDFKVEKISYLNFILLPFAVAAFLLERILKVKNNRTPLVRLPTGLNSFAAFLLSVESLIILKNRLPLGLGLLAVGRKPENEQVLSYGNEKISKNSRNF